MATMLKAQLILHIKVALVFKIACGHGSDHNGYYTQILLCSHCVKLIRILGDKILRLLVDVCMLSASVFAWVKTISKLNWRINKMRLRSVERESAARDAGFACACNVGPIYIIEPLFSPELRFDYKSWYHLQTFYRFLKSWRLSLSCMRSPSPSAYRVEEKIVCAWTRRPTVERRRVLVLPCVIRR